MYVYIYMCVCVRVCALCICVCVCVFVCVQVLHIGFHMLYLEKHWPNLQGQDQAKGSNHSWVPRLALAAAVVGIAAASIPSWICWFWAGCATSGPLDLLKRISHPTEPSSCLMRLGWKKGCTPKVAVNKCRKMLIVFLNFSLAQYCYRSFPCAPCLGWWDEVAGWSAGWLTHSSWALGQWLAFSPWLNSRRWRWRERERERERDSQTCVTACERRAPIYPVNTSVEPAHKLYKSANNQRATARAHPLFPSRDPH